MDITKYYQERWLKKHSKGIWQSADGSGYIEMLSDSHLMRIPKFLYNKGKVRTISALPSAIREEVIERGMTIQPDFSVTKDPLPEIVVAIKQPTPLNNNRRLLNKIKLDKRK